MLTSSLDIEYFERAALVQPGEVKWQLMVTSCYRRLGDFYKVGYNSTN